MRTILVPRDEPFLHQKRRGFTVPPPVGIAPAGLASRFAAGTAFVQATIAPGGVPSSLAIGGAKVTQNNLLQPAGLASRFAAGTPTLSAPQTVTPGGVSSGIRVGIALVAGGELLLTGVPSAFVAGNATVRQQQVLSPNGLPTALAFGRATVRHVQTVQFTAGVPSSFAAGMPTLVGGPHFLLPRGVPAPGIGIPTVVGGDQKLTLLIGGADCTKYLVQLTLNISSQTIGRWLATCKMYDATGQFVPVLAQAVMVMERGRKLFAGCIQDLEIVNTPGNPAAITFNLSLIDKAGIMDHRVILPKTYPAGTDVATVILDIVQNSLQGEGITTGGVPNDGSLGVLPSDLPFNFDYVTQGFDQLAALTGTIWYVTVNGDLTFDSLDNLPGAPFAITDTSQNWRNLKWKQTTKDYANEQFAVSNLAVEPGAGSGGGAGGAGGVTETFDWANGQPGIQSFLGQPAFVNVALPIGSVLSVTVDGVDQTVVNFADFNGQTSSGPNDYVWFYASSYSIGTGVQSNTQVGPQFGPINPGATIVVVYVPFAIAGVGVGEALAPTPLPGAPHSGTLGTCGSGRYQAVEQVQDISTQDDLDAIAQAVLDRRNGIPIIVTFETDTPGLAPGQLLPVGIPRLYLDTEDLLITGVQGTSMGDVDLGSGSGFRWQITATSNLDPGNWIKWYERLIVRTQNPLPLYQFEIAPFILAPGLSLSGGAISTNPYIVKRTGLLWDMYAAAELPPIGQDLVLTAYVNGLRIPGQVVIPAGSTPNTEFRFTFPQTSPLYVFSRPAGPNDIITVSASYRVTGGSPAPASNISFDIRWRF